MTIERGSIWETRRGYKVLVVNILKHADDCTSEFVFFQNLDQTFDNPPGMNWMLGKEAFASRFKPVHVEDVSPTTLLFSGVAEKQGMWSSFTAKADGVVYDIELVKGKWELLVNGYLNSIHDTADDAMDAAGERYQHHLKLCERLHQHERGEVLT